MTIMEMMLVFQGVAYALALWSIALCLGALVLAGTISIVIKLTFTMPIYVSLSLILSASLLNIMIGSWLVTRLIGMMQ